MKIFPAKALHLIAFCFSLMLQGCGGFFFYPQRKEVLTPQTIGLAYEDIWLDTPSNERLHGWLLPSQGVPHAVILHLHGNAENISTHLGSVYWLPRRGFSVVLIDYRGYGRSEGRPTIAGVQQDAATGLRWVLQNDKFRGLPVIIFGQSLGGAAALTLAGREDFHCKVSAVVADSAFSSYRGITKEKLAQIWLTWPLQWVGPYTVPSQFDAVDFVGGISPAPVLFMHSRGDTIVPAHHTAWLYEAAREPKDVWWIEDAGHTSAMQYEAVRSRLVEFLEGVVRTSPRGTCTSTSPPR